MLKKILLALSALAFVIGSVNLGEAPQWGVGLPLGAVLFALFFIVTVLEREAGLYDLEHRENPETTLKSSPTKSVDADLPHAGKAAA